MTNGLPGLATRGPGLLMCRLQTARVLRVNGSGSKNRKISVTPGRDTDFVVESQAVQFGEAARSLSGRARSIGLKTPVFKSPPRILGVSRTVRRRKDGQVVVAIAFRNRPWPAVLADLIDGVLHVNDLTGAEASRARDDLWETFSEVGEVAA